MWALLSVSRKTWYSEVRLTPTASGYVDQRYVCAVLPAGEEVGVPICMVVTLKGGRVKRLEEYIEAGVAAPATAALQGGA
jgi:hypothetical protein